MRFATFLSIAAGVLLLPGLAMPQTGAQQCSSLPAAAPGHAFPNPTTVLVSAKLNPASAAQRNVPALPEHCEVMGKINERIGFDSQHYAIRFHMRLPTRWNGRFFFQGGGGSNGNLGDALGNLQGRQPANALELGYAVVSQDSGHDNNVNNDPNLNGTSTFAFDPQARIDFGYNSYDQVTQAAKALIRIYYGRGPERSYYVGCSEGGREGLVMSQRFPSYYDGILSCDPGLRIPQATLAQTWDFQAFAQTARTEGIYGRYGQPFVNKSFTDEDLALAASAVLEACDSLDGLKDGIVNEFLACGMAAVQPKFDAITCKGAKRASCLSSAQVTALKKVFAGPRNSQGEALYSDWPWDAGIGGKTGESYYQGWRIWKLGAYQAPSVLGITTALVAPSIAAFSTPPEPVKTYAAGPAEYLMAANLDAEAQNQRAISPPNYRESQLDLMNASSTNLSAFKSRGGKLILVHGGSDPIFSINDSIRWWNEVNKANGGNASDFIRLFAVPGMNHCTGGPATDQFNAFAALVDWVEKNTAPERIVATAGASSPWPGRTRPLCAYPKIARYNGSGSIESAANFMCQ